MTRVALIGDNQRDPNSRAAEHDRVLDFVAAEVVARGCHALAHTGDWFERRSTAEDRRVLRQWRDRVRAAMPVVGVAGNHCAAGEAAELSADAVPGLHDCIVADSPRVVVRAGVAFGLAPWPRRELLHAWLGREVSRGEVDATANELLKDVLRGIGAELAALPADMPRVLVIHAEPAEYKLGADQPLHVAEGMKVAVEDMVQLTGVDVAAVGHIHRPDCFLVTRADGVEVPVILVGSPRRTAYASGELEEKSITILEFDGRRLVRWERIPTPATPLHLVETAWGSDGLAVNVASIDNPAGAEIRLRYAVPADEREAARRVAQEVADAWTALGAAEVQIEEVVLSTSRARMPELAACATIFDRLRLKWERDGDVDSERAARLVLCAEGVEGGIS